MQNRVSLDSRTSLFSITWPIFIELFLQILVGNVDQMMLSRYSETAVAAVGNANQIINVLILIFSVISLATTILAAQYLGAGNTQRVSQIYMLAIIVNIILSIIIAAGILWMRDRIFLWMAAPAELIPDATLYIVINGGMIVVQALFMTYAAIFRSNALMKESMLVAVMINIANIVGNAILIGGVGIIPAMGVAGAAIASVLSRGVGLITLMLLLKRRVPIQISWRTLRPFPANILKRLLIIGLPAGGESLNYNMTQMCCLAIMNTMGTLVVTTKVYAVMFGMIAYLYTNAIAQASQIVIGYMVGAGAEDEADRRTMRTLRSAVPMSTGIAFVLFLLSDVIFGFFTQNPEILRLGKIVMGIEIFLEFGRAFNIVLVRALQGVGDVQFPVLVGILSQWAVGVGMGFVLGVICDFGIAGLWTAMACDECLRGAIMLLRWKSGVWRGKAQLQQ